MACESISQISRGFNQISDCWQHWLGLCRYSATTTQSGWGNRDNDGCTTALRSHRLFSYKPSSARAAPFLHIYSFIPLLTETSQEALFIKENMAELAASVVGLVGTVKVCVDLWSLIITAKRV